MAMNGQRIGRRLKSAIGSDESPNCAFSSLTFWCGSAQEFLEQAELVQQLERRGVDRVAAEVAQEVAVLLQHQRP